MNEGNLFERLHLCGYQASYDSEPGSILDFQRELSTAIAQQVLLRLSPDLVGALAGRRTRHAEDYDL